MPSATKDFCPEPQEAILPAPAGGAGTGGYEAPESLL